MVDAKFKNHIKFLQQQNYEIFQKQSEDQNGVQEDQYSLKENQSFFNFSALKQSDRKYVNIKFCINNKQAYLLLKNESQILSKLSPFDSIIKYYDHIDQEDSYTFTLITESYENTLEEILVLEKNKGQSFFNLEKVVNELFNLINQLFEMHSLQILHYNINPDTVVLSEKRQFKLKDPISDFHLLKEYNSLNNQNLLYQAPEINNSQTDSLTFPNDDYILLQSADIYSLGLVALRMIGLELNKKTIELIQNEKYEELKSLISPEYKDILAFIRDYMVIQNPYLRYTVHQLKRTIFKFYEGQQLIKQQEINRLWYLHGIYTENEIKVDKFKLYLNCLIIQIDGNLQVDQRKELIKEVKNYLEQNPNHNHILYQELGFSEYQIDDYKSAFDNTLLALKQRENIFNNNHQILIESLRDVGICSRYIYQNNQCLEYLEAAETLSKKLYLKNHDQIAHTLKELAYVYEELNQLEKSEKYLKQVIEIRESLYSPNHYLIIKAYQDYSDILGSQKLFQEQIEIDLKVQELILSVYKQDHQMYFNSCYNLGCTYSNMGQEEDALQQHLKCLSLIELFYPQDKRKLKRQMKNIAYIYQSLQLYEDSLQYLMKSYRLEEEISKNSEIHEGLADILQDIAECYLSKQDFENEYIFRIKHLETLTFDCKIMLTFQQFNDLRNSINRKENRIQIQIYEYLIKKVKLMIGQNNPFIKSVMEELILLIDDQEQIETYQIQISNIQNQINYDDDDFNDNGIH